MKKVSLLKRESFWIFVKVLGALIGVVFSVDFALRIWHEVGWEPKVLATLFAAGGIWLSLVIWPDLVEGMHWRWGD